MKTLTIVFVAFTMLSLKAYSQNTEVKKLLNKPETRTEIFKTIAGDHELMTEFMSVMRKDKHASMMMKNEKHQMDEMNKDEDMEKMKSNPEMMQKMMGNMMEMCKKDSAMSSKMADMMTSNPEMMQMCMKKMKEKGMMGDDGKMNMMDKKGQSEKKEHKH